MTLVKEMLEMQTNNNKYIFSNPEIQSDIEKKGKVQNGFVYRKN